MILNPNIVKYKKDFLNYDFESEVNKEMFNKVVHILVKLHLLAASLLWLIKFIKKSALFCDSISSHITSKVLKRKL